MHIFIIVSYSLMIKILLKIMKATKHCYHIDVILNISNDFAFRYNENRGLEGFFLDDVMKQQYIEGS